MKKLILTILLILLFSASIFAEEKERVAVMDLTANNCPKAFAKAVTDMLAGRVYDTDLFTIMERDQMATILKEQELQMTGCTDASCAVKVGQLLSIRKIIIGSVNKLINYSIEVKIVNVETGRVEANFNAKAANDEDLEKATVTIARKMAEHYGKEAWFGEHSYFVSFAGTMASPMGTYAEVAGFGYGVNLSFGISHLMFRYSSIILSTGFYEISSSTESTKQIQSVPLILYGGYSIPIFRRVKAIPHLGSGFIYHMVSIDKDGQDSQGNYEYEKKTYYDPLVSAKCEFDYMFSNMVHLVVAPYYMILFEKSNTLQKAGADFGVKLYL